MAGFECEFIEKPPKAFQWECPICLLVLREPYQATCCGKSFCKECIESVRKSGQDCPTCNNPRFEIFRNLGLEQPLCDFKVYCTHKSKGCEWTGELRELDNHLNSDPPADKSLQGCPYTLIKCPLSCAGCEKGVCRKDVKSHVNDNLLGHVMMQNAQMRSFEQQLQECHSQLQEHRSIITELKAQLEEGKRDKKHLEERMARLEAKSGNLDTPMVVSKPQAPGCLDTRITSTVKPVGAELIMANFDEYKRDNDSWHSPHFHTHPNGYKMCLHVFANGVGSRQGTHLTVYVCLMRGEFDEQLKWPFRGNISIRLVNQEEDKDNIVKTITFNESTPQIRCQRVKADEPPLGCGCNFLSLTELQPKYLKNDCIKLCIKKVEVF